MTKSKGQIIIILIGVLAIGLAIKTMLHTRTVIMTPFSLVVIYVPLVLLVSFGLGLLIKKIIKGTAFTLTYTSIFATLISITYIYSEYMPTRDIVVPSNYSGNVRLFLSTENEDDFNINSYGIGYISKDTYHNGFRPTVIKNGKNITKDLTNFSSGGSISFAGVNGTSAGPYRYVQFTVPGQTQDTIGNDLQKLIEIKALDTTRIKAQTNIND
ncbi:MAG: hypothetical protein ABIQ40_15585 [Bacteroidia bacterium]